ncbi:MAG: TIGR02757 family protein [Treponema sp.]|nr:TIGR02757 family protein [Treponema sp.]
MKSSVASDLDRWYSKFFASGPAVRDFIAHDPVQFPRRYTKREDIEIAAFLAATIAWGRRDLIIRSCEKMFALMDSGLSSGGGPAAFVMAGNFRILKDACVHRTFFEDDLKYFCTGFRYCYTKYGSLEKLFSCTPNVWDGISLFREEMAAGNKGRFSKHIANPAAGSACKRINLALRWLARPGPVDLGLWKKPQPAALYIPLDVHVARTSRKLGLLQRKSNDRKAVTELTERLRDFCPEDPVKYDYALFGISAVR